MSADETYNGWTNRETWAVALHINNDQGWQESVLEALREQWLAGYISKDQPSKAGDVIRNNVEEVLDFEDPSSRSFERIQIAQEIGSLWRVDWQELGAAFLSGLEDN